MNRPSALWLGIVGLISGAAMVVRRMYRRDICAAYQRTATGSQTIETGRGPVEYAEIGDGPPVLIIHGAGGGYDQGLEAGRILVGEDYRIIALSRFGYLNAPIPADHSLAAQADTYASLLDTLGIDRIILMGISAGGMSSLHFASRYPDRIRALILYSAISYQETPSLDDIRKLAAINRIVGSDFVYWLMINIARPWVISLFGVTREVQAGLSAADQAILDQTLQAMLPMSRRIQGISIDQRFMLPRNFPLRDISIPTLIFHARDDTLVPFNKGQHSAQYIPNAEFIAFERGGHFLAGHAHEIHSRIRAFLGEPGLVQKAGTVSP